MGRKMSLVARTEGGGKYVQPELDLGLPPRVVARKTAQRRASNAQNTYLVGEFHVAFNLPIASRPRGSIGQELSNLRIELIREEFEEFKQAVANEDVVAIADALGDIVYVAYGAAITYGIDLDAVLREIHRANMSKLGPDGSPVLRQDGKVLKGDGYFPPDIRNTLLDQPPLFLDW
ncbi:nucleoside triphosphate pyrophosphohydrolase family protein [Microbacterium sp. EST19A]|uniref:nucleoside triphosphate pyrophosphohydrolase family protein n=1 Tax=Microbacterium sp. EST19A TaxID=2862681 RepID=UPI001CBBED0A|nr:nucleoside triphosphate pyrophosphohydrolase family protein [Microbacterium sp. EST19A]